MTDLSTGLGEAVGAAFAGLGLPASLGRVAPAIRRELADFQCNGAMAAGKTLGRDPREIGAAIAAALRDHAWVSSAEIAGPGFVNIRLTEAALSCRAGALAADPRAGAAVVDQKRRVLVDYAGPNVAKEMHVGHLRTTVIGDALVRLMTFVGHTVVRENHIGDWGTPFGMLIEHLVDL
ncbi:MAG: arginine--tRNA ligase, partial [Caulobacteraceae bacterium]